MPSRNKASSLETTDAVERSLLEWGVKPSELRLDRHSIFCRRVVMEASVHLNPTSTGGDIVVNSNVHQDDLITLPQNLEDAIELVYTHDLREYLDNKTYRLRLENENLIDSLETLLTAADSPIQILKWPPNYVDSDGVARTKGPFRRFDIDPFERFKLGHKEFSKAELAYHQCNKEDWKNGYAFEAIVASHAIHNEPCYCCDVKGSLFWCGGADSSWRDLYCHSCSSCFEIKSKKDCNKIDAVFRFNNLSGGSYRRWCQEGFPERRIGRDYIVLVNRESTCSDPGEVAWDDPLSWKVDIAEVKTALPRLIGMSFVDFAQQKERISLKTTVTLQDRGTWFHVQEQDSLDFEKILKRSFENVFPRQWDTVAKNKGKKLGIPVAAVKVNSAGARWQNVAPPSHIPHYAGGGIASTNAWTSRSRNDPSSTAFAHKNNSTPWSSSTRNYDQHHGGGGFPKRSARTDISSLNSSFGQLSIGDGDDRQDFEHDYCDNDVYVSGRMIKGIKGRQSVNTNDKSMDLCKHNGFKMMDNGHYGKRGRERGSRGGKKGGKKYDSDYY
jgi:hypothetical protein